MKHDITQAVAAAVSSLYGVDVMPELTRPDEKFGDYATNVPMQITKLVGKNPRQIAEELVPVLQQNLGERAREITIAGPGFINICLSDEALTTALNAESAAGLLSGQKILVEYSDPNPFKPLHAGHLYTTLVGDAIARLVERDGADVIRLNFGGDVGLHVGKSMWSIIRHFGGEYPERLADVPEDQRPQWLGERYVEGNTAYEDDPEAKDQIVAVNKRVYQLHEAGDKDSAFARIYWTCRQWSYDYFATLYDQLGVVPFDRFIPESEVTEAGVDKVREQLDKGVYEQSDGAVVFDGDKHGLHTRVFINSAGLPTYETKDVGLLLTKWQDYHFDQSIIITANEQNQYMKVVQKSIEQFEPEPVSKSRHITHGIVKLQGGVKMSSRRGNTVTALDIIESARAAGAASGLNPGEGTILAAIKYAMLKPRIGSDVIYDPKESIALEGNSGPYLQYAHARARSIIKKSAAEPGDIAGQLQPGERSLIRKITEFPEVVDKAALELMPHYVCTYLYELAQSFNYFYEHNRVIGDDRQALRLALVRTYADTLQDGLNLLGIEAPERM